MELKTGADAFAAAGLTEIRHRGGNLEWPVKLLLGAQRVVRYGVVAGAGPTGAERRAGWEDVEFDASFVAVHLRRQGCGARRQSHKRYIARSRRRLTTRLGDRICVLQGECKTTAERNRLFQRCAELALFIRRVDPRTHASDVCNSDRCPGGSRRGIIASRRQGAVKGTSAARSPEIGADRVAPNGLQRLLYDKRA
jgi:hypothetical protein